MKQTMKRALALVMALLLALPAFTMAEEYEPPEEWAEELEFDLGDDLDPEAPEQDFDLSEASEEDSEPEDESESEPD